MITPEELKRNLNKLRLHNESILIDIIFGLIDIEDRLDREEIPIEEVKERIQRIKENIGRELKD
jgi:CII-binding regulator of phage lambda lysogenization HflD